jgi:hypothetical protein
MRALHKLVGRYIANSIAAHAYWLGLGYYSECLYRLSLNQECVFLTQAKEAIAAAKQAAQEEADVDVYLLQLFRKSAFALSDALHQVCGQAALPYTTAALGVRA